MSSLGHSSLQDVQDLGRGDIGWAAVALETEDLLRVNLKTDFSRRSGQVFTSRVVSEPPRQSA